MKRFTLHLSLLAWLSALLLTASAATARPLGSSPSAVQGGHGGDGVATVARANGDYSDPVAAMRDLRSWCPAPSAANPCLLRILPGVYSLGARHLAMVPHVDIEGSGEGSTKITATGSSSLWTGTVIGADAAELRAITIENTGGGTASLNYATAIFAPPLRLTQVTAHASGGGAYGSTAIAVLSPSSNPDSPISFPYRVSMSRVTAIADGGSGDVGIYFLSARASLEQMRVVASSGIVSLISQIELHDVRVDALDGTGLSCAESNLDLTDVTINAATGIHASQTGGLSIRRSSIFGSLSN